MILVHTVIRKFRSIYILLISTTDMDIQIFRDPVYHLMIEDFFPIETNKHILKEAKKNEQSFQESITMGGKNPEMRTNIVCYYDEIYKEHREKSVLLTQFTKFFLHNKPFREILESSPYPFRRFTQTDHDETQVSRYGRNQEYKWHIDSGSINERLVTVIYYFNTEPQQWTGGDLSISNSPIFNGGLMEKNPKIKTIKPKNNLLLVISAFTPHRVKPTISPANFIDGRFSVNCWVGFKR